VKSEDAKHVAEGAAVTLLGLGYFALRTAPFVIQFVLTAVVFLACLALALLCMEVPGRSWAELPVAAFFLLWTVWIADSLRRMWLRARGADNIVFKGSLKFFAIVLVFSPLFIFCVVALFAP
jgi:hypothetical protein